MSGTINKVILMGRVGKDPEVRSMPNGTPVASLSLATDEGYTKDGTKHEKTEWHNLVAYAKQAELLAMYTAKGKRLYVEGRKQTRQWEDRDGSKRERVEIVVDKSVFVDFREAGTDPARTPPKEQFDAGVPAADDDLPF